MEVMLLPREGERAANSGKLKVPANRETFRAMHVLSAVLTAAPIN